MPSSEADVKQGKSSRIFEVNIQVAVRIRPLLPKELLRHHCECVKVIPGSAQVTVNPDRLFTFDHAFGPSASQDEVYRACIQPMVRSLLDGYNATVFCYGETGSGKTYTISGGGQDDEGGIIEHVARDVFGYLDEKLKSNEIDVATVHMSYLELYMEEVRDLLDLPTNQKGLNVRDDINGNTADFSLSALKLKDELNKCKVIHNWINQNSFLRNKTIGHGEY
uniref:Kinesin motor domain-containing protein n=1 Tax=Takifugu rubripes TaxID=31033 RepID=H2S2Z6_TAKRU